MLGLRGVEHQPQRAVGGLDHLAFDEAAGVEHVLLRHLRNVEQGGVEEKPRQHLLVVHGLRNMVDRHQPGACGRGILAGGLELDLPHARQVALGIDEVEQAAAHAADRWNLQLAGADGLPEGMIEKLARPVERRGGIVDLEADGANRRAVRDVVGVREAFLLGVHHEVDAALRPSRDRLGLVHAGSREPEAAQQGLEGACAAFVDCELQEFGAEAFRSWRHRRKPFRGDARPRLQLVEEEQERAIAVDRHAARLSRPGTGR